MRAVLFVCLGNICRSPLAQAALEAESARRRIPVHADSAGTGGWHAGDPPDPRSVTCAASHGIDISHQRARQVTRDDFDRFDMIVALDRQNLRDVRRVQPPNSRAELSLLLDHAGRPGQDVADPYYGGPDGFDAAWRDATAAARGIMDQLA
ncbi:low molecular weight protein-tyrosine-phosphatase [Paracoccus sp. (in: a-proteobacteria)]|uniref:low molecular weight protein-tyrosine-phosphatase n=1 Tax=Paracoccus sp. TaxID=267 RepID=UPI0026DF09DF|nr:low molecular weight protein-tyrosine-phosphatase [Paracoccus sp. (in: a-proteobacteria)]MDO5648249.1 low molecular weight protein-tyrosine-phosphatase [Paracoccus sp. (in: a-proteobacteria)]